MIWDISGFGFLNGFKDEFFHIGLIDKQKKTSFFVNWTEKLLLPIGWIYESKGKKYKGVYDNKMKTRKGRKKGGEAMMENGEFRIKIFSFRGEGMIQECMCHE